MKKLFVLAQILLGCGTLAMASTIDCTVSTGGVVTSVGDVAIIAAGTTGGTLPVFNCPGINPGAGNTINNLQMFATSGYDGGPFGTTSGTTVTEVFSVSSGPFGPATQTVLESGGNAPSNWVPPTPFQFGSTLNGLTSTGAFIVNLSSIVSEGGPVGTSTGTVLLSYTTQSGVPEPAGMGAMGLGLLILGLIRKRKK